MRFLLLVASLFLSLNSWISAFQGISVGSHRRLRSSALPHFHLTAATSSSDALTNDEISRYSRHLVLSDVGVKGQTAFKNASVLVIGAGGLGSPCLLYLAAAGVGHIGIVDGDIVDESNLQRQVIHGTSTVGISKCLSAQQRVKDINPNVNVRLYEQEFTSQTALSILGDGFEDGRKYDVVVVSRCVLSERGWIFCDLLMRFLVTGWVG
jgi:hypothetical protein